MKKILVVVDTQNGFMTGALKNDAAASKESDIAAFINEGAFDEIYVTQDTHDEADKYLSKREGQDLPVPHCEKGTWDHAVADKIKEALDKSSVPVFYFEKPTFGSLDLANCLHEKYGDGESVQFTFIGFCTGICVISNVCTVRAACPEAVIYVVDNLCACVTDDTHKTAIDAMKTLQVKII